jgi:replication factor C subunit 1
MDSKTDLNIILGRQGIVDKMTDILQRFDAECRTVTFKKGIYIYGSPGTGKTQFVTDLLSKLGYDAIVYNSSDVRNKQVIDHIASHHISNRNVLDMMYQRHKPIAIVMDEIDGMNNSFARRRRRNSDWNTRHSIPSFVLETTTSTRKSKNS